MHIMAINGNQQMIREEICMRFLGQGRFPKDLRANELAVNEVHAIVLLVCVEF
jgi:hypothetical protein